MRLVSNGLTAALVAAAIGVSVPVSAQAGDPPQKAAAPDPELARRYPILRTVEIPTLAHRARKLGVPDRDMKRTVGAFRDLKVEPADAAEALEATVDSVEDKGPVENFGTFVRSRLEQGLRGRALAAAIRAEHGAHGIGKGKVIAEKAGEKQTEEGDEKQTEEEGEKQAKGEEKKAEGQAKADDKKAEAGEKKAEGQAKADEKKAEADEKKAEGQAKADDKKAQDPAEELRARAERLRARFEGTTVQQAAEAAQKAAEAAQKAAEGKKED